MHVVSTTGRRERALMTIAALAGTLMLAFSAILIGGALPSPGPWGAQDEAEPPSPAHHSVQDIGETARASRAPERPVAQPVTPEPGRTQPSRPTKLRPARTPRPVSSSAEPSTAPEVSAAAPSPLPSLVEATPPSPEPPRRTKKPKRPKRLVDRDPKLSEVPDLDLERGGS